MELQERKDRFTEIIMAVEFINLEGEEKPLLPQRTLGLSDGNLRSAVIAQAFREGEDFSQRLTNALVVSALENINETEGEVTPDDLSALGLSASIAWAYGESLFLMKICGLVAEIVDKTDADTPIDFAMIFRPNDSAIKFGNEYEPYDLLQENLTTTRAMAIAEEMGLEDITEENVMELLSSILKDHVFGANEVE